MARTVSHPSRVEMMTTPERRLSRMRKSFEKNKSVLVDDYAHFTTQDATATLRESTRQNKAARKLAGRHEQQSRGRSETQSSDRTGD